MYINGKFVLLSVATATMLTLTGCGSDGDSNNNTGSSSSSVSSSSSSVSSSSSSSVSSSSSSSSSSVNKTADVIDLATGLNAEFFTREAANKVDMGAFYPYGDTNPTHMIFCIEGGAEDLGNGKKNPSLQSFELATGTVTTILRGMERCDGARVTPWNSVLATEEAGATGGAYEIIDPLAVTEMTVTDRDAGTIVDANGTVITDKIVKRTALPSMSWEGIVVLESGVVIGGDELRPGTDADDADGGAIFKFVPATARTAGTAINTLAESPLAAGSVYAMRTTCKDGGRQWGQGCEVGVASWIEVNASTARADADANGATGYYRPEDLHTDPTYTGSGVRFCWANTGNEDAQIYGEVVCGVDTDPLNITDPDVTSVNRFVEGDLDFTSVDNLDFQPTTGNLYAIEDHKNGDIWACLKDGADRDIKTDGCIRLLSVKDQSAEPTGFMFSPDGKTAYVNIQHSNDTGMALVDGYATDDIIKITGFQNVEATADFGKEKEDELHSNSDKYFGFTGTKQDGFDGNVDRNTTF